MVCMRNISYSTPLLRCLGSVGTSESKAELSSPPVSVCYPPCEHPLPQLLRPPGSALPWAQISGVSETVSQNKSFLRLSLAVALFQP